MSASPEPTTEADGAESEAAAHGDGRPLRLAVVGVSEPGPCGVRDHGRLLAEELEREGLQCSRHWMERGRPSLRGALAEAHAWGAALPALLASERADAVVVHYSCFASAHRGVPVFSHPLTRALRRAGLPVVAIMHELTYPFGPDGARGLMWATTQRLALFELVNAIDAALVTTEDRREWLAGRRWLPRRPVAFAPVFSNLPPPSGRQREDRSRPVVGQFGYHYDGSGEFVLQALRRLVNQQPPARAPELRLIGSPGPDSRAGRAWRERAAELGISEHITFTGLLEPQPLSDELAAADLLVFPDPPGPSSRKGTLAASLASGAPIVALDGPLTWGEFRRADALRIVPRDATALAREIAAMLDDPAARAELGARGRRFAAASMGVERTAAAVRELLGGLVSPARAAGGD
jgi:glycosyltransferase involved in cell wall biosynthesis